ncbi:MAG: hypothetical protein RI575_10190 [Balneolaceae bacterium]|nr:hypothetical protein [Balneolaceae bacterium]MDR9407821.1 hypothetical protein [Balneolaceae bacterium]
MANQNFTELFQKAENDLNEAREELYQPAEDVVTYSVCVTSRRALYNFLSCLTILYAEENDEPVKEHQTIEAMIEYCSQYNDLLKEIDFSGLYCKCQKDIHENQKEAYFCNDVQKVNYCRKLAEKVRELVIEKGGEKIPQEA